MAVTRRSHLELGLFVAALVAVTPTEAYAYVDPGTGSYLFQLATAGLLAAAFTIRRYWDAVRTLFRGQAAGGRSDPSASRPNETGR